MNEILVVRCMACPEDNRFTVADDMIGRILVLEHLKDKHPEQWTFLLSEMSKD